MKRTVLVLIGVTAVVVIVLGSARTIETGGSIQVALVVQIIEDGSPINGADATFTDASFGTREPRVIGLGMTDEYGSVPFSHAMHTNFVKSRHLLWKTRRDRLYLGAASIKVRQVDGTTHEFPLRQLSGLELRDAGDDLELRIEIDVATRSAVLTAFRAEEEAGAVASVLTDAADCEGPKSCVPPCPTPW